MSETMDFLLRGKFINVYTKMESSDVEKGIIYVEDASDFAFWSKVLKEVCPNRYDIKTYSNGKQGKRVLEKEYSRLHKELLVAVDSDFDYVCPERNEFSLQLNNNPFILHTVYYSRESYILLPESLDDLTDSITFSDKVESEIHQAMERYSALAFEALKVFSFLHNKNQTQFSETDFSQCLKLPPNTSLLNESMMMDEEIFSTLSCSVNAYVQQLSAFIDDNEGYQRHVDSLEVRNITPDKALLFVDGHDIMDFIVRPLMVSMIKTVKGKELNKVVENYPSGMVKERKNQVHNHFNKKCNLDTLLYQCKAFQKKGVQAWEMLTEQLRVASSQ